MRVKIFMKFFIAIQVSHPPFFSLLKIRKTYNFFLVLIRRLIKLSKKFENVRRYNIFVKEIDERKKKFFLFKYKGIIFTYCTLKLGDPTISRIRIPRGKLNSELLSLPCINVTENRGEVLSVFERGVALQSP